MRNSFPTWDNMMQEPAWADVAQRIHAWLHTRELG
jgi:hypothetical protein